MGTPSTGSRARARRRLATRGKPSTLRRSSGIASSGSSPRGDTTGSWSVEPAVGPGDYDRRADEVEARGGRVGGASSGLRYRARGASNPPSRPRVPAQIHRQANAEDDEVGGGSTGNSIGVGVDGQRRLRKRWTVVSIVSTPVNSTAGRSLVGPRFPSMKGIPKSRPTSGRSGTWQVLAAASSEAQTATADISPKKSDVQADRMARGVRGAIGTTSRDSGAPRAVSRQNGVWLLNPPTGGTVNRTNGRPARIV